MYIAISLCVDVNNLAISAFSKT